MRGTLVVAMAATLAVVACQDSSAPGSERASHRSGRAESSVRAQESPIEIEVFAPEEGHLAGVDGIGWFVDLAIEFEGDLTSTGFTGNQLTGPGVHDNTAPFPGVFAPGKDDRFGGLISLFTTTTLGAGACQNLANLFNLTGPTNVQEDETEIWDTWIITTAAFGVHTQSTMYTAIAADLNHDGIFNDAPDVVPDANHDGVCNEFDIKAYGSASKVAETHFTIN
jgi:hypothetical protein